LVERFGGKVKKTWKDYLTDLCDKLPSVGIDPTEFQKAMKHLPEERLTSETYAKLSNRAKYGISEITVGLSFLHRDLCTIRNAGKSSKSHSRLVKQIDVIFPLYKKALKQFNTWEQKGYPHV
jgi:hypothetical protein